MKLASILTHLRSIGFVTGGVLAHHYGSQFLDRAQSKYAEEQAIETLARIDNLERASQTIHALAVNTNQKISEFSSKYEENTADKITVTEAQKESMSTSINNYKSTYEEIEKIEKSKDLNESSLDNLKNLQSSAKEYIDNISNTWDEIIKSKGSKLLDDTYQNFTQYLDTLSLFQEASLLNIIILFILFLTGLQILLIFFGNELINYFKLEKRFPSLAWYIKLRTSLQRYYLMWNIFILSVVCIIGILINLLPLIY